MLEVQAKLEMVDAKPCDKVFQHKYKFKNRNAF